MMHNLLRLAIHAPLLTLAWLWLVGAVAMGWWERQDGRDRMFRKTNEPKPHPDFVASMLDCFDRADPTRSKEALPSERWRNHFAEQRLVRRLASNAMLVIGVVLLIAVVTGHA